MRSFASDFLASVGRYLGIVLGGLALFMVLTPLVGYTAYSDRPGPGWHGGFFQISWSEFVSYTRFIGEWFVFFVSPYALVVAVLSFAVVRIAERLRVPVPAVRGVGGIVTAGLTFLMLAAAGWYISLGLAAGVWATALGAYVGARHYPKRVSVPVAA